MHPSTADILKHFSHDHLPEDLQEVSKPACELAHQIAEHFDGGVNMTHGGPEVTAGLRKLLEAKDCFVRAALNKRESGN